MASVWQHIIVIWAAIVVILILLAAMLVYPRNADCYWCTPIFCAFDHDCPQNCSCCVAEGDITGECC